MALVAVLNNLVDQLAWYLLHPDSYSIYRIYRNYLFKSYRSCLCPMIGTKIVETSGSEELSSINSM